MRFTIFPAFLFGKTLHLKLDGLKMSNFSIQSITLIKNVNSGGFKNHKLGGWSNKFVKH